MTALISSAPPAFTVEPVSVCEVSASFLFADRVKSLDSHQSNSVMLLIPHLVNHFLLPNGAQK